MTSRTPASTAAAIAAFMAVVSCAWAPLAATASARSGTYGWPLSPRPSITHRFDPPEFRYGRGHRGVDLAAPPGSTVYAAGPGTVAFAGLVAGRGVVSVDHPGGLRTTYEPVHADVHVGDTVWRATPLGALDPGHPGCPQAACLHWGLRRGGDYLDPLTLLGAVRVRLKPLAG